MKAAVVTVSDTAYAGTRTDESGPAVAARLEEAGFTIGWRRTIPDDRQTIAHCLRSLVDAFTEGPGAIFTTGGTGITPRDVTPEATRDVIDREIPGMGELMRSTGLQFTPYSSLSRALAGTSEGVLIVNLPGSPRGALQSLDAILKLVPHVLDLINGRTEHGRP